MSRRVALKTLDLEENGCDIALQTVDGVRLMKNQTHFKSLMALAALIWCAQIAPVLVAQNPAPSPDTQSAPPPPAPAPAPAPAPDSQAAPVQLSVDVWNVLKLAHANVSDEIITAYIKNSGKVYSFGAPEILYLREQGLSDRVVATMLDQRKNVAATTPQAPPPPTPQPAPSAQPPESAGNTPQYAPPAPQPQPQPAPTYVQTAPVYVQPSPVYVYSPSYPYYYYPSPYYYGPYWGSPAVSFSFGFGGGHYGGYRGGGFRGGHR